jgi:putative copper export protein/mono/diheme cytochrome c family protein
MDRFTLIMAGIRGIQLAALLSLFGTLVFATVLAPAAVQGRLTRLTRISGLVALAAAAVWLTLEAAAIAGAGSVADTLSALPVVVTDTRFGQLLVVRLVLLLVVLSLAGAGRAGRLLAVLLAGGALALQSAIGHVGAIGGGIGAGLVVSESLHLLAAGAWLGGLLPLLLSLRTLPAQDGARVCENFTPIGLGAVLIIAGTALAQGLELIGGIPALFGTAYGRLALLKLVLFLVALGFAARNRLSLTDRLSGADPDRARRQLRRSITSETLVGLAIVLAAGVLASLAPGTHQQPDWPFPVRLSWEAISEPDLRQQVFIAAAAITIGLCAVLVTLVLRRLRIVAALLAVVLIVWWTPSLGVLLVEAYPTSFYTSPTGFGVESIAHGQALFAANCSACHGAGGQGNGPEAAHLHEHPADLTASHLWEHSDGELFWWISHGIEDPEGGLAMPGFADRLSATDRWALIDFVRANNAGAAVRTTGNWAQPVLAPDLPIQCADSAVDQASALRGKAVIVVAGAVSAVSDVPPQAGVPIAVLYLRAGPSRSDCVADTPDAWTAYAILAGVSPDRLSGSVFLIDPNGWLRTLWSPEEAGDTNQMIASLRSICEHPISSPSGGEHAHHH